MELGTSIGISSAAMAIKTNANVLTLEGCPETAGIAQQYFEDFQLNNITVKVGEFDSLLKNLAANKHFRSYLFRWKSSESTNLGIFPSITPASA